MTGQQKKSDNTLSGYFLGESMSVACQADQRFSYCTYAPREVGTNGIEGYRLLVVVHSTTRDQYALAQQFAAFADKNKFIILAPLFPAGIIDPDDTDNYKYILYKGIRFDHILLSMVDEVVKRYSLDIEKFSMFGFSGGAHFVHRFLYLHPDQLDAASIIAPGSVTLIDDSQDWWVGTRNVKALFGIDLNMDNIRRVRVHLAVGAQDISTAVINHHEDSERWMPGANDAGSTRVERMKCLWNNLKAHGLDVRFECVPDVGHTSGPLVEAAQSFFLETDAEAFDGQCEKNIGKI